MSREQSTVVGYFSEAWDAERAIEDLSFAGFQGRIRYIQQESGQGPDNTREGADVNGFFARVFGFEKEDEYNDARGHITVSPDAEKYVIDLYHSPHHVVLIQAGEDKARALEILTQHHARVEEQNLGLFQGEELKRISSPSQPSP